MSIIYKPLISAILPTFNRLERLKERIYELEKQTIKDWELIIIDDCSTDGTANYIKTLTDPRIKTLSLDRNSGTVTIPRNIGITMCNGKFICHIDDDVRMELNKFEVLSDALTRYSLPILAYGNRITTINNKSNEISHPDWNPFRGTGVDNSQIMYRNCYDSVPLVFCTRECDWQLAKILRQKGPFIWVNKVVSEYIWHDSNRSLNPETKFTKIDIDYYSKYIPKHFKILLV